MQSFSTAHATTYGDAPHEHEGVTCAVIALTEDEAVALPEIDPPTYSLASEPPSYFDDFKSIFYLAPKGRSPPPRAPPVSH